MKLFKSYLEKGQYKKILDELDLKLGRFTDEEYIFFSLLSKLSDLGLNHKDILFVKKLYPIELHTLPKAEALGDKKMSKQKYLNLKLN